MSSKHTFTDYFKSHAGLITQAVISIILIVIGFKYDTKVGVTVTPVIIAIDGLSYLMAKFKDDSDSRIDALSNKVDLLGLAAAVYQTANSINNLEHIQIAQARINECVGDLEQLAHGKERIANETDYFSVLIQEALRCEDYAEVWDVVMPFYPRRVGKRMPLNKYVDTLEQLIKEHKINYNLILMPRQDQETEAAAAMKRFQDIGIHLTHIDRSELPSDLIANFSIYMKRKTVCWNQRADDGHILNGQRSNNQIDYEKLLVKLAAIKQYAKPFSLDVSGDLKGTMPSDRANNPSATVKL